jgi:hypothetical protein
MLYLHNFEPSRWPAGNPETGYLNCDGSPTKTEVLRMRGKPVEQPIWQASFGKRPWEELFNVHSDPECMINLAAKVEYQKLKHSLQRQLFMELASQNDPRMAGRGEIFERYPYADPSTANFYQRYIKGEKLRAGWVNRSDFQGVARENRTTISGKRLRRYENGSLDGCSKPTFQKAGD